MTTPTGADSQPTAARERDHVLLALSGWFRAAHARQDRPEWWGLESLLADLGYRIEPITAPDAPASPETVTIGREDAHLAWNVLLEREQTADTFTRRLFGACADRFASALRAAAEAGADAEGA